mgnify:CR=1 FL=1
MTNLREIKGMSNFKKTIIALFILLLGIPLALFGYTWIKLNSIHVDSKYDSTIEKVDGITNILLTGIDARPGEQASRTDAMMILTIDKNNNEYIHHWDCCKNDLKKETSIYMFFSTIAANIDKKTVLNIKIENHDIFNIGFFK